MPAGTSTPVALIPRVFAEGVLSSGLWKRLLPLLALIKAGAGLFALIVAHEAIGDSVYLWYFHAIFAVPFLATGIFLHLSYARYFRLMLALAGATAHVVLQAMQDEEPDPVEA